MKLPSIKDEPSCMDDCPRLERSIQVVAVTVTRREMVPKQEGTAHEMTTSRKLKKLDF